MAPISLIHTSGQCLIPHTDECALGCGPADLFPNREVRGSRAADRATSMTCLCGILNTDRQMCMHADQFTFIDFDLDQRGAADTGARMACGLASRFQRYLRIACGDRALSDARTPLVSMFLIRATAFVFSTLHANGSSVRPSTPRQPPTKSHQVRVHKKPPGERRNERAAENVCTEHIIGPRHSIGNRHGAISWNIFRQRRISVVVGAA